MSREKNAIICPENGNKISQWCQKSQRSIVSKMSKTNGKVIVSKRQKSLVNKQNVVFHTLSRKSVASSRISSECIDRGMGQFFNFNSIENFSSIERVLEESREYNLWAA